MSKLEKIKSLWRNEYELEGYDITEYIELPEGYIDWLIEQAEEVERLKEEKERLKKAYKVTNDNWKELNKENKQLRSLLHTWGLNPDAVPREMPESMSMKDDPF